MFLILLFLIVPSAFYVAGYAGQVLLSNSPGKFKIFNYYFKGDNYIIFSFSTKN